MRVGMMPHKNYHAETMYKISLELKKFDIETIFFNPVETFKDAGVDTVAQKYNFILYDNNDLLKSIVDVDAVMVMNDWDMASKHLLVHCKENDISIIGLQEGICDFERINWDNKGYSDPTRLPYSYCDCIMLCSHFDATYFKDIAHTIVGMERVEHLYNYDVKFPEKTTILINVNFSYNVCTEFSRDWLEDVVAACEECGFEYIISRHPQDQTDISGYEHKISDKPLHDLLMESTVFVSRFSNAIYESLIMGKPCIFYNPHNERARNFNETMDAFSACYNKQELIEGLLFESAQRNIRERAKEYLETHVSLEKGVSSAFRTAEGINKFLKEKKADIDVSVIIAVYNTEKYIAECLDSLINQTKKNIEIICVDDASTDGSVEVIKKYCELDSRVKLFKLSENSKQGTARNYGMKKARGKAILFIDSDDWVEHNLCERVYNKLKKDDLEVVVFNYYDHFPDELIVADNTNIKRIKSKSFIKENLLNTCGVFKMYSKEFLKQNGILFPEKVIYEDWFWTIQWVANVKKIDAIDEPLYYYRKKRNQSTVTSSKRNNVLNDIIKNIELSLEYLSENNLDKRLVFALINKMQCQTSRLAKGKEKEQLEKIIRDFLKRVYPDGLPKGIYAKEIKDIYYNRENSVNKTTAPNNEAVNAKTEQTDKGKEIKSIKTKVKREEPSKIRGFISKIYIKIVKPIMIKISPTYRLLRYIEINLQEGFNKQQANVNQTERNIYKNTSTLFDKYNKNQNRLLTNKLSKQSSSFKRRMDEQSNLFENKLNEQIELFKQMLSDNNKIIDTNLNDKIIRIDEKVNMISRSSSSNESEEECLSEFAYSKTDDGLNMVQFNDQKVYFSDRNSFDCVYKEVFINEEYYIDFKRDNPRILDCGAHIGMASLYLKNRYPEAKITAFEPDPNNLELLKKNMDSTSNQDVEIVEKAVGNYDGEITFFRAPDMSMGGSVTPRMKNPKRTLEEFNVPICRLRNYIIDDKIDFLKLDVEGIEDTIIKDCQDCIKNVNYIFIEFHLGDNLPFTRINDILNVLEKAGFDYNISKSDYSKRLYNIKPFKYVEQSHTHLIFAKNKTW